MIERQPDLQSLTRDQDRHCLSLLLAHFNDFYSLGDLLSGLLAFNCFKLDDFTFLACNAVKDAANFTNFFSCMSVIACEHPELDACFAKFMNT